MACYGCGSELGDNYRLCPNCIKRKNIELATLSADIKKVPAKDSVTHRLSQDPRFKVILFIIDWAVCAVAFTLGWEKIFAGAPISGSAIAVMSLITALLFVHLLTGLYFWVKMMTLDFGWFVICWVFPPAAYFYVYRYWEEAKINFAIHIISMVVGWLLILFAWPIVKPMGW